MMKLSLLALNILLVLGMMSSSSTLMCSATDIIDQPQTEVQPQRPPPLPPITPSLWFAALDWRWLFRTVDLFKQQYLLHRFAFLNLQHLRSTSSDATNTNLTVNGTSISVVDDNLIPIPIFANNNNGNNGTTRFIVDGIPRVLPPPVFYFLNDVTITITKVGTHILSIVKTNDNGTFINIVPLINKSITNIVGKIVSIIFRNVFATITESTIDDELLNNTFDTQVMSPPYPSSDNTTTNNDHYNDTTVDNDGMTNVTSPPLSPPNRTRYLRLKETNDISIDPTNKKSWLHHRSLQNECDVVDVIEIGVVVDSYMCQNAGDSTTAAAIATNAVVEASKLFEPFCKKLQISDLIIYCNESIDPIRPLIDAAAAKSNMCTLAVSFKDFLQNEGSDIRGDVIHLFHGLDFPGTSSIGCAWEETLCRSGGYNSGVNQLTFSSIPSHQGQ